MKENAWFRKRRPCLKNLDGIKEINVLIAEDDKRLQSLYKRFFKKLGLKIVGLVNNGEEVVKMFTSLDKKPDVIIMDNRMPVKNGMDAANEILKLDMQVKIIFVSSDFKIKNQVLEMGVKFFIRKPFSFNILVSTIKKCVVFK